LKSNLRHFNPLKRCVYSLVKKRPAYICDKYACSYSAKIITLNSCDSVELERIYGRKADLLFPTTFDDQYDDAAARACDVPDNAPALLFIGANFFGNTDGLFWFIENCLDDIHAELRVVGKNVRFHGYVDDIAKCYYQARAVVLPIISGGGMKTKTCEALMYGKTIFGTQEAFEGYDALGYKEKGWLCNTKEEFVANINGFLARERSKINEESRAVFLNNYATQGWEQKIRAFFDTVRA